MLVIAVAGGVGTALRHATGLGLAALLGAHYPFGTLAVNLLGSGLLGFVAQAMAGQMLLGSDARLVLGVGLLGGFTTYSSFNLELLRMLEQGAFAKAAGYLLATVLGCLVAAVLGVALARAVSGTLPPV